MVPTTVTSERAPCGQIVECETYEDQDGQILITQELAYACGCVSIRHEYHDGSVAHRVVRHDGTVVVDELLGAE
jgi:hypothetical protein